MPTKVNRIEPRSRKTRRQQKRNPGIVHLFNHQCYVTFITGCYSCKWKVKQEKKSRHRICCCSWKEQLFYPFLVISFCLSVVLLYVWIETSNEYFGFDWVVFLGIGDWFYWSIVLLSFLGILTAYSSLLLLLGFLLIWEGSELYLHWFHKILTLLVILLCLCLMWILCMYWKDRWLTAGLSLKVFAPYIHLSSITVMVLLSWPVAFYLIHLEREALQVAIGLPFFLILLCLYVVPLGIYSPCIQEKDKLGPKPDFFGHRGAPMLGPENTMMSFEKAVEHGAFGLETDVYLSYDEVPFLMHDHDLRRTTNIRKVMPNASFQHPSHFTWDFLSALNAGRWFVQPELKPFYNMKPLSKADSEKAENQTIPKLADLLELARKEKKFVIFDLHRPPQKHPVRNTYVRRVVSVILDSKIEQHLIFWLPGFDREYVKRRAPGFQQVGRFLSIENLAKENIRIINVDYKKLFYNGLRDYKAANITINLYIVNEPWLYSLAWCSRIHSVTTDNIQILSQLNHPYFFMTPSYYMFMWLFLDSVSAVFIVAIFYFHWWRESQKEKFFESTSIRTGTQSHQRGRSKNAGASVISREPPPRVRESPWTLGALSPALTKSLRRNPGPQQFSAVPEEEASKPLTPAIDDVRQPVPTQKDSEPIQEPTRDATREATLETALPDLQGNEPTISSIEVPHSETQPKKTPSVESSQ